MKAWLQAAWNYLRSVSGDNAYERYLEHHSHAHPDTTPLSRRAFYDESQTRKWSGVNRCC
jgi:uncharacterized short protein YbdD (DUF466 family)